MSNRCVINICKYSEHNKDITKKPEFTYINKIDIFDKLRRTLYFDPVIFEKYINDEFEKKKYVYLLF